MRKLGFVVLVLVIIAGVMMLVTPSEAYTGNGEDHGKGKKSACFVDPQPVCPPCTEWFPPQCACKAIAQCEP